MRIAAAPRRSMRVARNVIIVHKSAIADWLVIQSAGVCGWNNSDSFGTSPQMVANSCVSVQPYKGEPSVALMS